LTITVANTGSGHNFPTGFPEGRIAWLAVHAYDLATGQELGIRDSVWGRTSVGVGNLTTEEVVDPSFPQCHWQIPPGSADPYSVQWKAVASLGDGCPTLDLPYAAPLNMATNGEGLPVDAQGRVIEATSNSTGTPVFKDINRDGDLFDDAYLRDTRLKPMPHPGATAKLDRYAVVVPPGTRGPIAISATVYYQSVEAIVSTKFLGNMVDTNGNVVLEPCVLGGLCDGRTPKTEPPVVEGAPPVPMVVGNLLVRLTGPAANERPLTVRSYPVPGAESVYQDAVVKVSFSRPVGGIPVGAFTLTDSRGRDVPAWIDQIGDGTFGLFPNQILLKAGETYTARLKAGICALGGTCTPSDLQWRFTVAREAEQGSGNTTVPIGFPL
jgi:hypothetical protein